MFFFSFIFFLKYVGLNPKAMLVFDRLKISYKSRRVIITQVVGAQKQRAKVL